jgi:hypothetical protein
MKIQSLRQEPGNEFTAKNNFREIGAQNNCVTTLGLTVEQDGCRTLAYIVCGETLR